MIFIVLLTKVVGLLAYSKLFLCDTFSLSAKSWSMCFPALGVDMYQIVKL